MALIPKLQQIKSETNALLTYANGITGENDISLGNAVKTLADGYGQGADDNRFIWSGTNAELIDTYYAKFTMADTSYDASKITGSAVQIKSAVTNKYSSPSIAFGDKDIIVIQRMLVTPYYDGTETNKIQMINWGQIYSSFISKRHSDESGVKKTRQIQNNGQTILRYFNGSGIQLRASTTYGLYTSASAPSLSSATADSSILRMSEPYIAIRYSNTYASLSNLQKMTDFDVEWGFKIYTVDPFSSMTGVINDAIDDILTNGIA